MKFEPSEEFKEEDIPVCCVITFQICKTEGSMVVPLGEPVRKVISAKDKKEMENKVNDFVQSCG